MTLPQLFQRLDRASKGYVTHQDVVTMAEELKFSSSFMTAGKLKVVFKGQKTTFEQFVEVLLDKEALKEEDFKAQHFLSDARVTRPAYQNERDAYLANFNLMENRVVRKIDKLSQKVERRFLDTLVWLIELNCHEEFEKQQIKA